MSRSVIKGTEKEVNMGPVLDPAVYEGDAISIIAHQKAAIGVQDQDQTVKRELLLRLNLPLQIGQRGIITHLDVEESSRQALHHHPHSQKIQWLFVNAVSLTVREKSFLRQTRTSSLKGVHVRCIVAS